MLEVCVHRQKLMIRGSRSRSRQRASNLLQINSWHLNETGGPPQSSRSCITWWSHQLVRNPGMTVLSTKRNMELLSIIILFDPHTCNSAHLWFSWTHFGDETTFNILFNRVSIGTGTTATVQERLTVRIPHPQSYTHANYIINFYEDAITFVTP